MSDGPTTAADWKHEAEHLIIEVKRLQAENERLRALQADE